MTPAPEEVLKTTKTRERVSGASFGDSKWPPVPPREPGEPRRPMRAALLHLIERNSHNETGKCFKRAETMRRELWHGYGIKVHANSVRRATRRLAAKGITGHKAIGANRVYYRSKSRSCWSVNGTQLNWLRSETERREARWRDKVLKRKQRREKTKAKERQAQERARQQREARRRRAPEQMERLVRPKQVPTVAVSPEQMRRDLAAILGEAIGPRAGEAGSRAIVTPRLMTPAARAEKARHDIERARMLGFDVPTDTGGEGQNRRRGGAPPDQ